MLNATLSWLGKPISALVRITARNGDQCLACSHDVPNDAPADAFAHSLVKLPKPVSQTIELHKRLSQIGNMTVHVVGEAGFDTWLATLKESGFDIAGSKVEYRIGLRGCTWAAADPIATQYADDIKTETPVIVLPCRDAQRFARKTMASNLPSSYLSAEIGTGEITRIDVDQPAEFAQLLTWHDDRYTDGKNGMYGYVICRGKDSSGLPIAEVFRFTGVDDTGLTGVTRARLGTASKKWLGPDAQKQGNKIDGVCYLEGTAAELSYALLTGELLGEVGKVLPDDWHAGMSTDLVAPASFNSGWSDIRLQFLGLEKEDIKGLIGEQICPLISAQLVTNEFGQLSLTHTPAVMANAATVTTLDISNIIGEPTINHAKKDVRNILRIGYGWNLIEKSFSRHIVAPDSASQIEYGTTQTKEWDYRGLHHSQHSAELIHTLLQRERDWHSFHRIEVGLKARGAAALRLNVGDVVRVNLTQFPDYSAGVGQSLDRAFLVINTQPDFDNESMQLKLVGVSAPATHYSSYLTQITTADIDHPNKVNIESVLPAGSFVSTSDHIEITTSCTIPGIADLRTQIYDTNGKRLTVAASATNVLCTGPNLGIIADIITINGNIRVIGASDVDDFFNAQRGQPFPLTAICLRNGWRDRLSFAGVSEGQPDADKQLPELSSAPDTWPKTLAGQVGRSIRTGQYITKAFQWPTADSLPIGIYNKPEYADQALAGTLPGTNTNAVGNELLGGEAGGGVLFVCSALFGEGIGLIDISGRAGQVGAEVTRDFSRFTNYQTHKVNDWVLRLRYHEGAAPAGAPGSMQVLLTDPNAMPPNLARLVKADAPAVTVPALENTHLNSDHSISELVSEGVDRQSGTTKVESPAFYQHDYKSFEYASYTDTEDLVEELRVAIVDRGDVSARDAIARCRVHYAVATAGAEDNVATGCEPATNLTVIEKRNSPASTDSNQVTLQLGVTPPADQNFGYVKFEYRVGNDGAWYPADSISSTAGLKQLTGAGQAITVRATTFSLGGIEGGTLEQNVTLWNAPAVSLPEPDEEPALPKIRGLRLANGVSATEWKGLAPEFVWTPLTDRATGLGGAVTTTHSALLGYNVRLFDADTGLLIKEKTVQDERLRADDLEKFLKARSVRLVVRALGKGVPNGPPSEITVTNPVPAAPAAIKAEAGRSTLNVSWQAPTDQDFSHVAWRVLAAGKLVAEGTETGSSFVVPRLTPETEYTIELTSFDVLGPGESASVIATTQPPLNATDVGGLPDFANLDFDNFADVIGAGQLLVSTNGTDGVIIDGETSTIQTINQGFKTRLGLHTIGGVQYVESFSDGDTVVSGRMPNGDQIQTGTFVITGGSGFGSLSDRPQTLADLNPLEATKFAGIEAGATNTKNTSDLVDDANLGGTADWSGVSGANKPDDNANRTTNTNQLTDGAGLGTKASWPNVLNVPARFTDAAEVGLNLTGSYLGYYDGSQWQSYMDDSGFFRSRSAKIGGDANDYMMFDGSALVVRTDPLELTATGDLRIGDEATQSHIAFKGGQVQLGRNVDVVGIDTPNVASTAVTLDGKGMVDRFSLIGITDSDINQYSGFWCTVLLKKGTKTYDASAWLDRGWYFYQPQTPSFKRSIDWQHAHTVQMASVNNHAYTIRFGNQSNVATEQELIQLRYQCTASSHIDLFLETNVRGTISSTLIRRFNGASAHVLKIYAQIYWNPATKAVTAKIEGEDGNGNAVSKQATLTNKNLLADFYRIFQATASGDYWTTTNIFMLKFSCFEEV